MLKSTTKIANDEKEHSLIMASKDENPGTSIEFDKNKELHIYADNGLAMIDRVLGDVEGKIYISSNDVASFMEVMHKNLMADGIQVVIEELELIEYESGVYGRLREDLIGRLVHQPSSDNDQYRPWFIKSSYLNQQNKSQPCYLISSDAIMFLNTTMPRARNNKAKHKHRQNMSLRIIDRMRHYQSLLQMSFHNYIGDIREHGKLARRNLTNSIKWKIMESSNKNNREMSKQEQKEIGKVYAFFTSSIYQTIGLPERFHKGMRDKLSNDILFIISTSENIIASYLSMLDLGDKELNVAMMRRNKNKLSKGLKCYTTI